MRAFIIASSPKAIQPQQEQPRPADLIIAADGGANWCAAWDWRPDLVVGDMDSVDPAVAQQLQAARVPFLTHPVEKDETDLELALSVAQARGASEIIIAGALGGRIDHTLGNLHLLLLPALQAADIRVVDGGQTLRLVREQLIIEGQPGDTLSLIPWGGPACRVSIDGVHWPLSNADLSPGPSLGISNRLTAAQAEISVSEGALLVVHTRNNA